MLLWYKITLTNDQVMAGANWHILNLFQDRYVKHGHPLGVALLDNANPTGGPLLEFLYYFTPESVTLFQDLIQKYNGESCDEPAPECSTYLRGDPAFLSETRAKVAAEQKPENC